MQPAMDVVNFFLRHYNPGNQVFIIDGIAQSFVLFNSAEDSDLVYWQMAELYLFCQIKVNFHCLLIQKQSFYFLLL